MTDADPRTFWREAKKLAWDLGLSPFRREAFRDSDGGFMTNVGDGSATALVTGAVRADGWRATVGLVVRNSRVDHLIDRYYTAVHRYGVVGPERYTALLPVLLRAGETNPVVVRDESDIRELFGIFRRAAESIAALAAEVDDLSAFHARVLTGTRSPEVPIFCQYLLNGRTAAMAAVDRLAEDSTSPGPIKRLRDLSTWIDQLPETPGDGD